MARWHPRTHAPSSACCSSCARTARSLITSTILAILSQAAAIAVIVLTGFVINELRGGQDGHQLALLICAILGVGLLRAVLMLGRRFISGNQALGVEWDMRDALYAHLLRLSFGYFDRHQTGQLMSRATVDLQTIRFFLGYGLIFFAQHVITIVCVTGVLFFYDWQLALIALAITPFLVGVAYRYSHVSHPVLRDVQQQLADVATVAEESIVGVHVVKAFAQEEQVEERFREASDGVFRVSVRANTQRVALRAAARRSCPCSPRPRCCSPAATRSCRATLTIGGFFAFNLLLMMLVMPLRMLGMWIGQAQRATAVGRALLRGDRRARGGRRRAGRGRRCRRGRGAYASRTSTFGYERDRPVLAGVDLEIEAGRDDRADRRHRLRQDDARLARAALLRRRRGPRARRRRRRARRHAGARCAARSASISQDPFLFSASVRDNIAFGVPDVTDELVEAAARAAQAHEFIEQLPDGYDTVIGERGITLSGGQRQRLAIARALVIDPRILILDDATASVDATTEALIRAGLAEAMRGRTTIVIAHRLSTIALADEIVVLEHGRDRGARHARRAAASRARSSARSTSSACSRRSRGVGVKVWQAGSHLSEERGGKVGDWSWAQSRRRLAMLFGLAPAVPAADDRRGRGAVRLHARRARAAAAREDARSTRASRPATCRSSPGSWLRSSPSAWPRSGLSYAADVPHRLGRRARARGPAHPPLQPPAAPLARLLRAQPHGRASSAGSRTTSRRSTRSITDGVTSLVQNLMLLIGTAVVLFVLDWRLALATLAVFPLMALATLWFRIRSNRAYRRVRERIGLVTATLAEDISGMRVVQSYAREPRNQDELPRASTRATATRTTRRSC